MSEEKLKKEKELEELKKQKEEYLDGWKRERAGFLNYKKDEIERIEALIKYANEELILKFLPILDNIYLAEKQLPDDLKNHKWTEGVMQIKSQIANFLNSQGVEEIKAEGTKFDPNFHEVVEEVAIEGKESGIVVEEVQKGYTLHSKIIRPAKVKVSK
jgi:molecular chaperone GrpE